MKENEGGKPESSENDKWNYNQLQDYLLRLNPDLKKGGESINSFPKHLEISGEWHQLLNRMRTASRDSFERYAVFAVREAENTLYLSSGCAKADEPHSALTTKAVHDQVEIASRHGVKAIIGDIHSHPTTELGEKLFYKFYLLYKPSGFSAGDYYGLLLKRSPILTRVLIEEDANTIAFLTKESKSIPNDSPYSSMQFFEDYWYKKAGAFSVNNSSITPSPMLDIWQMNLDIAHEYSLALYRGKPDKVLIRSDI